jgi:hypothetical protein
MSVALHFSQSYAQARTKFLTAAHALALPVDSRVMPDRTGVDGETLAMDVALLGDASTGRLLVLTSATHGIEGYCGSGCQIALLRDAEFVEAVRAADVGVLFVHAVNPHGFSHGRRVNEDNVDLNRNFRDFSSAPTANAAYAEVHPLLLPATWPPPPENEQRIGAYIAANGMRAFQAAVSGGQYDHADGLFYGGVRPTWSNRTLRDVVRRHTARVTRLGWIDVHTGLGPRGHGELIHAGRNLDSDLAPTRQCWGDAVTSIYDGTSASAIVTGMATTAGFEECPGAEFTSIGLEYGTLPITEVLLALRADHWLHNHPEAPAALATAIRAQVRAAFYGDDDEWKTTVHRQARDHALKAVAFLSRTAS